MKNVIRNVVLSLLASFALMQVGFADPVFHDLHSKPVKLTNQKNKWLVVNYWASWCGTCMQEMPELNRLYRNTRNKDIAVYGVNFDHLDGNSLKEAVNQASINFPVLMEDPSETLKLDSVEALPTTFIINPEGRVVKKIVGGSTESYIMGTIRELQRERA